VQVIRDSHARIAQNFAPSARLRFVFDRKFLRDAPVRVTRLRAGA
jgi:hypothetical protein